MSEGNSYQNNNQPTRDRHAIGDFRLHLTAEPQQGGTKSPRLSIYYHRNKVSIEVRTNVPSDMNGREHGIIRAELDPQMFFVFMNMLQKAVDSPTGSERPERIRIKRPDFQKRNNGEPVLDSQLAFGKDQEGVVYMSVLSWNKERPAIRFPFTVDKMIELTKADGSPWSKAEASVVLAQGYLDLWGRLIPIYMYERFKPEEFKGGNNNGGNRGGGGGYNNNGGGNGGGYSSNNDMRSEPKNNNGGDWNMDDMPF